MTDRLALMNVQHIYSEKDETDGCAFSTITKDQTSWWTHQKNTTVNSNQDYFLHLDKAAAQCVHFILGLALTIHPQMVCWPDVHNLTWSSCFQQTSLLPVDKTKQVLLL